ncbi:MAG: hypothetical protein ACREEM_28240 [Blastocatellia bacterium]
MITSDIEPALDQGQIDCSSKVSRQTIKAHLRARRDDAHSFGA